MITTWETPQEFFDMLDREFGFTVDVCALAETAKCARFYSPEIDGLKQDWSREVFFMNPPYGRGQDVYSWVKKACEAAENGATGCCLLPASTGSRWFNDFCLRASEIRFVRDRLYFSAGDFRDRSNHASMVVVFRPGTGRPPRISTITNCRGGRK